LNTQIVFESASKWLLFLHLFAAFVLAGSLGHLLVISYNAFRRISFRQRLFRLYGTIVLWAYTVDFLLGSIIYPTFRVRVRADYFDPHIPQATGLFEIKEHWAAVGMGLAITVFLFSRDLTEQDDSRSNRLFFALVLLLNLLVWYLISNGFYLVTLRSI
jgi:hypothetical protein